MAHNDQPATLRDVASAAADVSAIADALGIGRFAVMGHSGGGAHALAWQKAYRSRGGYESGGPSAWWR